MRKTFKNQLQALVKKQQALDRRYGQENVAYLLSAVQQVLGATSYKDLLKLAGNPNQPDELRQAALTVLLRWSSPNASHLLVRLFVDDQQRHNLNEIRYHWPHLIKKRHLKPLFRLMQFHSEAEVRQEATYLVSFSKDVIYAYPILLAVFLNEAETLLIRGQAAEGLGYAGKYEAVPFLLAALANQDVLFRWEVIFALGAIGDPRAIPSLEEIAHSDAREITGVVNEMGQPQTVQAEALEALAMIHYRNKL